MKLKVSPLQNTYDVLTKRWGLSNATLLTETKRATVFKVDSPAGPAAFKLYTEIGYGSERAAVSFARNLPDGIGARIFKSDFMRAAVLTEWLSGPPLSDIYGSGDYLEATAHACTVIKGIARVRFRGAFAYRRLMPLMRQRFEARLGQAISPDDRQLVRHAIKLLDDQFGLQTPERVVHGDLHYGNIILTPDGPRAFDPKGVRAHPLMECRSLFRIPTSEQSREAFSERHFSQIAMVSERLGYSRKVLLQFSIFRLISRLQKPDVSDADAERLRDRLDLLMDLEGAS